jgi:hypothetical protein
LDHGSREGSPDIFAVSTEAQCVVKGGSVRANVVLENVLLLAVGAASNIVWAGAQSSSVSSLAFRSLHAGSRVGSRIRTRLSYTTLDVAWTGAKSDSDTSVTAALRAGVDANSLLSERPAISSSIAIVVVIDDRGRGSVGVSVGV